jgi:nucleoside-diphosphate-sugar epimerase
MANELVLVTGGSGFVASHCILQLLDAGYNVRTTVRSLSKDKEVRDTLMSAGMQYGERLTFAATDLTKDAGWAEAIAGCTYVQHVASPFPAAEPKNENDLIIPAKEGALRVLKAARDAGVKRVVLTSSFVAIGYGHAVTDKTFTEKDWSNLEGPGITAYAKSKTIAERAAWDFIKTEGNGLELAVVNPVGVFGPVLGADYSTSIQMVKRLMDGTVPACPKLTFGVVVVRDVADLHIRAMTNPAANGERFLAVAGDFMSMLQMALALKKNLGEEAKRVPTKELPNWILKIIALFDPAVKLLVPELGKNKNGSNEKAKTLLGWKPRSSEEAITATAQSLVNLRLLKHQEKK